MNTIKVSVIIPVYNTANYVAEAIQSITAQSLTNIEIIAINDGSTDNSLETLNALAVLDSRIKVISYETNVGVSICRNTGIKYASGEFIYFFDSDDLLDSDCLEACYNKSVKNDFDFLIFDGEPFYEERIKPTFNANYRRTRHLTKESYTGIDLLTELYKNNGYSCSVCLCFIKRSYLQDVSLNFMEGVLYEDVLFTILLYLYANKITFINRSFFHRRIRSNSTMTSSISQLNIDYRLTIGNELLQYKTIFNDKKSRYFLNHEAKHLFLFLVKVLLNSKQFNLLIKNAFNISRILVRSLF